MTEPDQPSRSKRPYRDSLIINLVFAALIIVVAWVTGGDPEKALVFAVLYLVAATAWTWWHVRRRLSKEGS